MKKIVKDISVNTVSGENIAYIMIVANCEDTATEILGALKSLEVFWELKPTFKDSM